MLLLQAEMGFAVVIYLIIGVLIVFILPLITVIAIIKDYKLLKSSFEEPTSKQIIKMVISAIGKSIFEIVILILIIWIVPYLLLWLLS